MKLRVRPVDLQHERSKLLELLDRNLGTLDHAARFDWLYNDNPAGRAWSWFVCVDSDDRPVGVASLFPRFFWIDGRVERCGEVGDFAVDADHRSLGPALRLQRATFEPVDEGLLTFCYDCPPDERGMAPFHRLGLKPVCRATRYRCLLRTDELVRRRIAGGWGVQAPLSSVFNALLWARRRIRSRAKEFIVDRHEGPFGEEFDALESSLGGQGNVVRLRRMAEDLNWLYRRNPVTSYETITVRRDGELMGFVVFSVSRNRVRVVDLVASSDRARLGLLREVVDTAGSRRKEFVDMWRLSTSRESGFVHKAGFVRREPAKRFVVYPPQDAGGLSAPEWHF